MPHDPHLAELLRAALAGWPGIQEKKMFGGVAFMLNGNMLAGVEKQRYMFRVGKALEAEALARPGATPMDLTGKPMSGFVFVDPDEAIDSGLESWIELAARFVGSLPPK